MKCNLATWDRITRFIIGLGLMTFAFAGGPLWCYLGFYLMGTAGWGFCPLALAFGFQTVSARKIKIEETE